MSHFEVVAYDTPIVMTFNCVRTDLIFADPFEAGNPLRWSGTQH